MSSLSTKPNLQKLIHDVQECVSELKRECNENGTPIDDDNKTLQRLCAKLEYLLQYEQIDHSSFLGGRKDYWNYICDGLSSTKGVRDGLKYVKTLSELKTNLGRGRAFIRFALTYQHLADSLQQCINDQKLTREWYTPASVWLNEDQCRFLISVLYDLNDVRFDLGAKGYDLDNGWPLFARRDIPAHKWNVALSRTSSIGSLNSSYNDSSLKMDPVPFVLPPASHGGGGSCDPDGRLLHEVDREVDESPEERLTRELDQSELICGDLAVRVSELEGLLQAADRAKDEAAARRSSADELTGVLQSRCADLERQIAEANAEAAALRQSQVQHDLLASDCEQLTRECERLRATVASESARHREAEERLQKDVRSLESRLAVTDGSNAELSLALKTTVEESRLCARQRDEVKAELERVSARLADAQTMNAHLRADLRDAAASATASASSPPPSSHSDPRLIAFNLSASVKELLRAERAADLPTLCAGLAARVADGVVAAMFVGEAADGSSLCAAAAATERDAVETAVQLFAQRLQGEVDSVAAGARAAANKAAAADELLRQAVLQRSVDDLTARLGRTDEDLAAARGALEESRDALRRVELERGSLERSLIEATDAAKHANEAHRLSALESAEQLSRVLSDLKHATDERDGLARALKESAAMLTKTVAAAETEASRWAAAEAATEAEHRRTVAGLMEQNSRLDNELADLRLLVERLQLDVAAAHLQAQNKAHDVAQAAAMELEQSAGELCAERRRANERESVLGANLATLAAEADELRRRSQDAEALSTELGDRTRDLEEQLVTTKKRLLGAEAELAAAGEAASDARASHESELGLARTTADAAASEALAARRAASEAIAERERAAAEAVLALDAARAEHAGAVKAARAELETALRGALHERETLIERLRGEHAVELERAVADVRAALSQDLDAAAREAQRRSREAMEAAAERSAAELTEVRASLAAAEGARAVAVAERDRVLAEAAKAAEEARAAIREIEATARQEAEIASRQAEATLLEARAVAERSAQDAAAAALLQQAMAERLESEKVQVAALRDELEAANVNAERTLSEARASFEAILRERDAGHAAALQSMEAVHATAVGELGAVHAAALEKAAAHHETVLAEALRAARQEFEKSREALLDELKATKERAETKALVDGEALTAVQAEAYSLRALAARLQTEAEQQQLQLAASVRLAADEAASALQAACAEAAELQAELDRARSAHSDLQHNFAGVQQALEQQGCTAERQAEELAAALAARDDALARLGALQLALDERTQDWQRLEESCRRECDQAALCVRQAAEEREGAAAAVRLQLDDAVHSAELLAADLERALMRSAALETERDQATASLEVVSRDFGELKEMLRSLKQTEVEKSAELARLQVELDRTRKEFERSHATTEQQIAALKFQLSSQQLECEVAVEGYRTQHAEVLQLSDVLTRQEQLINVLESELQSIREEKSFEHDLHMQQLQDLNQEMTAKEEERHASASSFETVRAELENARQARSRLQNELVSVKLAAGEQVAARENELHQLRKENTDLRAKLVKLIRDKDNLWQKTDALVYRQKQKAEVKWMDDSVTTNCIACGARFALTLRKHHCRLCGRIYCHSCSNNWVNTPSSSRKARACNDCYANHDPDGSLNSSLLESGGPNDDVAPGDYDDGDGGNGSVTNGSGDSQPPWHREHSEHAASLTTQSSGTWPASAGLGSFTDGSFDGSRQESESGLTPLSDGGSASSTGTPLTVGIGWQETAEALNSLQSSSSLTAMDNQIVLESKQVDLLAGGTITVPLPIDAAETTLFWEFSSAPKGISFSVAYMASQDSTDEEILIPLSRCNSHRETIRGHLIAHLTGVYVFTFDNAGSRSLDKTVTYTFRIASP